MPLKCIWGTIFPTYETNTQSSNLLEPELAPPQKKTFDLNYCDITLALRVGQGHKTGM